MTAKLSHPTFDGTAARSRHPFASILASLGISSILIVLLLILFGLLNRNFFAPTNVVDIVRNASNIVIVSVGQAIVLIVGGFDLSVGAVIALASVVCALVMAWLDPLMPGNPYMVVALGILAALAAGAAIGLINGLCVALLKVSPFMVTLGTMLIASGIALYSAGGTPIYGMPEAFVTDFAQLRWLGLPSNFYLAILVLALVWLVMRRTAFGRHLYAIGGNIEAARASGVRSTACLVSAYVLCGFLAALTGVLLTARVGSGEGTLGDEFMLQSLAAAVIGGVSLRGGIGRIERVAISALLIAILANGMNLSRVDTRLQAMVIGVLLVAAVAIEGAERWKKR
ncbi:MAG: ABC transporter permease [Rhizobiaceae bacterium]|nr:ABC transporter permease [Rhizobiaceae bacterium]